MSKLFKLVYVLIHFLDSPGGGFNLILKTS